MSNKMTSKESALFAQMQDLGYSHGMVVTALQLLGQSPEAVEDALLYLYDNKPSEKAFVEYLADMCEG
jgi:hypothetical protein